MNKHKVIESIVVILFLVVIIGIFTVPKYMNKQTQILTVTAKEVKRDGDKDIYLIYTKDSSGEVKVLKNTDAMLVGKFNSSDFQADIDIDETYKFTTIGYSIPFFSSYENIIEYELME